MHSHSFNRLFTSPTFNESLIEQIQGFSIKLLAAWVWELTLTPSKPYFITRVMPSLYANTTCSNTSMAILPYPTVPSIIHRTLQYPPPPTLPYPSLQYTHYSSIVQLYPLPVSVQQPWQGSPLMMIERRERKRYQRMRRRMRCPPQPTTITSLLGNKVFHHNTSLQ